MRLATRAHGVRRIAHRPYHRDLIDAGGGDDLAFGSGGNDLIRSGAGDDWLFLVGNDILLGDAGNDRLFGGTGRSLLIGGSGSDVLIGGFGGTLLVGGTTDHDADDAALNAIRAEWSSSNSFSTRVSNIRNGGRLNGSAVLDANTMHADHAADSMMGLFGQNWLWAESIDGVFAPFGLVDIDNT